ncbi:NAD(P)-dependent oxidoreductase [Camelimonas fluminis]|uniref:dTDP-4-dehydrorhamnose reductase n=1 Tax=Camelimonas fluminis TaxID=1576911 RepID=A0ABV7UKA8_9HYPH|nr:dTDP-4-dehydrorhamnose reductase [Camelimonas fluminis]GHE54889.1 NAD(P)-dependent oxidoreductase [Camelimonas fluminis]
MRILVTGTEGQLVRSLLERAKVADDDLSVIAMGRPDLDLTRPHAIASALARVDCDVIVNAAAYTAVDQAESEPGVAQTVNCDGAEAVAQAAARANIPFIQISTDYVFNGQKAGAWTEDDSPDPLSVYGKTKLAGEMAVQAATPKAVILRTAWVYSPFGKNFVRTMLRLAESRDELSVVADQTGAPTSALDIADGVIAVARHLVAHPDDRALHGVFHMTATAGSTAPTWADFAEQIFGASRDLGGPSAQVRRITTAEYPTPAARPRNSLLDCTRLEQAHGVRLPFWEKPVADIVRRILADG